MRRCANRLGEQQRRRLDLSTSDVEQPRHVAAHPRDGSRIRPSECERPGPREPARLALPVADEAMVVSA